MQIHIVICLSSWLAHWWSYRSKWIWWGRDRCNGQCHRSSSWRPGTESSASAQVQWIFGQSQAGVSEEEKEWEIAKGSPTAVAGLVEQTLQVAVPIGIFNIKSLAHIVFLKWMLEFFVMFWYSYFNLILCGISWGIYFIQPYNKRLICLLLL